MTPKVSPSPSLPMEVGWVLKLDSTELEHLRVMWMKQESGWDLK